MLTICWERASRVLAPVIAAVCNASFQQLTFSCRCIERHCPTTAKEAHDGPEVLNDLTSYRPISNLSFLSKIVQKVVDSRLSEHIKRHHLLPVRQSHYRPFHSTETAVVSIHNHMIAVVDQGHIDALVLLDLSSAFDTVDHSNLMGVLRRRFGVDGNALSWVAEFLSNRR